MCNYVLRISADMCKAQGQGGSRLIVGGQQGAYQREDVHKGLKMQSLVTSLEDSNNSNGLGRRD